MEPDLPKNTQALHLTDFSLFQYQHTPDLYEQLLSDHQELPSPPQSLHQEMQELELLHNKTRVDSLDTQEAEPKTVTHQCSCAKSKCSKNYCECFRAGRQCSSLCSCTNCFNGQKNGPKTMKTISSSGGCNCKKTHCRKKYCECHSKGLPCSSQCNCVGCENGEEKGSEQKEENPFVVIDSFYS